MLKIIQDKYNSLYFFINIIQPESVEAQRLKRTTVTVTVVGSIPARGIGHWITSTPPFGKRGKAIFLYGLLYVGNVKHICFYIYHLCSTSRFYSWHCFMTKAVPGFTTMQLFSVENEVNTREKFVLFIINDFYFKT